MRSWACWASSAFWSQVSDRRSCSGRVVIVVAIALRTASAPCPASAGPFLARCPWPCPSNRGRCSSIVNRVVRSTRVPIAELPSPRIRSPSQWPGTARSATSDGRALIMTSGVTNFLPRPRVRAAGTRSARPVRRQATSFALERATSLHVKGLVDGLVRDPHRLIIGEVHRQAVGDLLRAPRSHPAPILASGLVPPLPCRRGRAGHRRAVRAANLAGQPVLDVVAQWFVGDQFGGLGPAGGPLGLPLRDRRPILQLPTSGGRVAADLPRHRRCRAAYLPRDLANPGPLGAQQRDLLPFGEGQIASPGRPCSQRGRHAAALAKPARPHRP